jgi:hypothetical protein
MTKQQSCVPWTPDALGRVAAMHANVFAAAGGVLIGITATLEA